MSNARGVGRAADRLAGWPAVAATSVYGFLLSFHAGSRGLFAFDQSIVFDGGWRLISGRTPYVDIILPNGPTAIVVQAVFFRILGVDFRAIVLSAAILNAAATLGVFAATRWLVPSSRWAPALAATVTATYFYAQFGTGYIDNTTYFVGLVAIVAMVRVTAGPEVGGVRRVFCLLGAGAALAATALAKVNFFAFLAPATVLMLFAQPGRRDGSRDLGFLALGFGATALAFATWLVGFSAPESFWRHVVEIPYLEARSRLGSTSVVAPVLFGQTFGESWILAFAHLLALVVCAIAAIAGPKRLRLSAAHCYAGCAAAGLLLVQGLFSWTTLNESLNSQPYLGLGLGVTWALISRGGLRVGVAGRLARFGLAAVVLAVTIAGISTARGRAVHGVFEETAFPRPIADRSLAPLRWGEPTVLRGERLKEADFVGLVRYLKQAGEPFFVFPDHTILYGIVGTRSPQPLLWFHRGVTFPRAYDETLDRRLVEALESNGVTRIVLERRTWLGPGRLSEFPLLYSWIADNFVHERAFGMFDVRVARWRR